jgi:hypothetical protein
MSGDVKQGSKVELPLWLGEMLAISYGPDALVSKPCNITDSGSTVRV